MQPKDDSPIHPRFTDLTWPPSALDREDRRGRCGDDPTARTTATRSAELLESPTRTGPIPPLHRRYVVMHAARTAAVALVLLSLMLTPSAVGAHAVRPSFDPGALRIGPTHPMIIVLRDQLGDQAVNAPQRATAVGRAQQGIDRDLRTLGVTGSRRLSSVDAVAAHLTSAEAGWFARRTDVLAVVPDRRITPPKPGSAAAAATTTPARAAETAGAACPPDPAHPLVGQDLTLTHAMSPAGPAQPAAQDLATGRGVRVGLLEAGDNLDVNNPEFVRSDGSHVIAEDRSFGSAGTSASPDLGGQEAFGDASAVAAQGTSSYDVSTYGFAQHPLPAGCNIRIRGMAPDANLYVEDFTFTSEAIAAIDHLVRDDHVDVINEAFWYQEIPDNPATDPFVLANQAAVRAGVTVVVPSNDGGIDSSQATPGSDPGVIDVGATTAGRLYEQLQIAGFVFSNGRAEDNQPSSVSSDGFATAQPRIIDVVAPGDGGWNACTASPAYPSCVTLTGAPSSFRAFRGTSESAPLTAGEAALVIERYRATHGGASPSPQQVKAIIMSSATDLHLAGRVQGSGLINALAAVRLAGGPSGLVAGGSSLGVTGTPGQHLVQPVAVTNNSDHSTAVRPVVQTRRTVSAGTTSLVLDPYHDPRFFCAGPSSGITRTIDVPAGLDQLTVEAAGAIDPNVGPQDAAVNLTLIDPAGEWANWSSSALPSAPFAHIEEAAPQPGRWKVVIWTGQNADGWHGAVTLHWEGSRLVDQNAGPVRTIGAQRTASVPVHLTMPAEPGDTDARVVLVGERARTVLPVALRTTVAMDGGNGSFAGTFTGIVGRRANGATQVHAYEVPVTSSRSLELDLHLASLTMVHAYLVDPQGDVVAERTNCIDPDGHVLINDLVMYLDHPMRGTWTIALELDRRHAVSSGYDDPFTGRIRLNTIGVTTSGLPNDAAVTIGAGHSVTATVTIANTGAQQQAFFADPRLNQMTDVPLAPLGPTTTALPTTDYASLPTWLVPPATDRLTVTGTSSVPFGFDLYPEQGDPDVTSSQGTTAVASVDRPTVAPSLWSLTGDVTSAADDGATATFAAIAHTAAFDSDVVSSTGDAWRFAVDPATHTSPLVVAPNGTGQLTVTITPHGAPGSIVSGTLYIDMADCVAGVGDTVTELPYRYTVG
jgi:hypothetical protein